MNPSFFQRAKKAIVAAVTGGAVVLGAAAQYADVIPDKYLPAVNTVLAVLTVLGVYKAKNAPKTTGDHAAQPYEGDVA